MNPRFDPELLDRLEQLLDGELEPGDPIEQQLLQDPALRQLHMKLALERASLREALKLHAAEEAPRSVRLAGIRRRTAQRHRRTVGNGLLWMLSVAAAFIAVAALYLWSRQTTVPGRTGRTKTLAAREESEPKAALPARHTTDHPNAPVTADAHVHPAHDDGSEPTTNDQQLETAPQNDTEEDHPAIELAEISPTPAKQEIAAEQTPEPTASEHFTALRQPTRVETQTTRPLGRVANVMGGVFYRRGGSEKWFKGVEGTHLMPGDAVDTRAGMMSAELENGAAVCFNRRTIAVLGTDDIRVDSGEVYCDIHGRKKPFDIVTENGTVRHIGTAFSVKITPVGTVVTVAEGKVEVSNAQGKVEIQAGYQVNIYLSLASLE